MTLSLTRFETAILLDVGKQNIQLEVECQTCDDWSDEDKENFKNNEIAWRSIRRKLFKSKRLLKLKRTK